MRKSWLVCVLLGALAWGQNPLAAPPPRLTTWSGGERRGRRPHGWGKQQCDHAEHGAGHGQRRPAPGQPANHQQHHGEDGDYGHRVAQPTVP